MPSLILQAMRVPFTELAGCDVNESAAYACIRNTSPLHFFRTVESQLEDEAFCYVHNQRCPCVTSIHSPDLLIAGYPCNRNSMMCTGRFSAGALNNEHADVLTDVASLIQRLKPRIFVLENVTGVLMKTSSSSDDTVINWVHTQLSNSLGQDYKFQDFLMTSSPLHPGYRL